MSAMSTLASAGTFGLALLAVALAAPSFAQSGPGSENTAIRPFRVNIPEEQLVELRRRVAATKWPEQETVSDATQGVQLATMQKLAHYWATEYDWRKVEARLNALPQFVTNIDGLDIHFIHVRSKNPNALPIITTHGWRFSTIGHRRADTLRRGSSRNSSLWISAPRFGRFANRGRQS